MSLSSYYARPTSANAFPRYSDAELQRDLEAPSLDGPTRVAIEAELARRAEARRRKRSKRSKPNWEAQAAYDEEWGTDNGHAYRMPSY